jgi:hypothetical protein
VRGYLVVLSDIFFIQACLAPTGQGFEGGRVLVFQHYPCFQVFFTPKIQQFARRGPVQTLKTQENQDSQPTFKALGVGGNGLVGDVFGEGALGDGAGAVGAGFETGFGLFPLLGVDFGMAFLL